MYIQWINDILFLVSMKNCDFTNDIPNCIQRNIYDIHVFVTSGLKKRYQNDILNDYEPKTN